MQKATIVVLDAVGFSHSAIAQWIGRDARTVEHWVNHWNQHGSVKDEERTGRPRLTDAATDQTIVLLPSKLLLRRRKLSEEDFG